MPFAILSTTLLYIIGPLALLSILFFNLSFVALDYNYVPTEELLDKDANRGYRNKIRSLWNIYCCGIGMVPRLCKRRKSSCLSYVYILWFALFQGKNTLFFALFQGKNVFYSPLFKDLIFINSSVFHHSSLFYHFYGVAILPWNPFTS